MADRKIIPSNAFVGVSEASPQKNHSGSDIVKIGYLKNTGAYPYCQNIGLLDFEDFEIFSGKEIIYAGLNIFSIFNECRMPRIQLYRNKTSFSEDDVTWETKPDIAENISQILNFEGGEDRYYTFDITDFFNKTVSQNPEADLSFSLIGRDCAGFAFFAGARAKNPPYLQIEYADCSHNRRVPLIKRIFDEKTVEIKGSHDLVFSDTIEMSSADKITFFVKNNGDEELEFNLQISPNDSDFVDDAQIVRIKPGEIKVLTPQFFAKYIRLCVKKLNLSGEINLTVWYQLQTNDFIIL